MNRSLILIERPVATTFLVAAIVLLGEVALSALTVNDLPTVFFPSITVTAELPGTR